MVRVKGLKDTPDTYIGTARIASNTNEDPDAFAAGFYAIAYEFSGQTVLAFRGTDNYSLSGDYTPNGPGGSDVWSGWTIAAGYAAASQAGLAIKFYEDVTGATSVFQTAPNVTLIGHSLGGGLAGFISALSGTPGVGFDYMPFGLAAWAEYLYAAAVDPTLARIPTFSQYRATHVAGEVLQYVRGAGSVLTPFTALAGVAAAIAAKNPMSFVDTVIQQDPGLSAYGGLVNRFDLHAQNLLVLLQYAQDNGHTAWQTVADTLLPALFDPALGTELGLTQGQTGSAAPDAQLRTMVAYSALDEGTTPFGAVAISGLFKDADLTAQALSSGGVNKTLFSDATKKALVEIEVQYAGDRAYNGATDSPDGALVSSSGAGTLTIDLSPDKWRSTYNKGRQDGTATTDGQADIIGRRDLISPLFQNAAQQVSANAGLMQFIGSVAKSNFDPAGSEVTSLVAATGDGLTITSKPGGLAYDGKPGGAILIGKGGSETITGGTGNDVLIAGSGDDTLDGGEGANVLIGGRGQDTFLLGKGTSTVAGGLNNAIASYQDATVPLNLSLEVGTFKASGKVDYLVNNSDTGRQDVLFNVSKLKLGPKNDVLKLTGDLPPGLPSGWRRRGQHARPVECDKGRQAGRRQAQRARHEDLELSGLQGHDTWRHHHRV